MTKPTLELLLEKINNGFKGTHRRLDESNHRMAKQEARSDRHKEMITNLEKQDIKTNVTIKTTTLFWKAMGTLVAIILGLAGFILGQWF